MGSKLICQNIANYLKKKASIGTTQANGNCLFHSMMVFKADPIIRTKCKLTISQLRQWVSEKFTLESYESDEYIRLTIGLWKSMFEDAYISRDFGEISYYSFIGPVCPFLPPTDGMKLRIDELEEKKEKTEEECETLKVFKEYYQRDSELVNIEKSMQMMSDIVKLPSFWGEEISIRAILEKLTQLMERPVCILVISNAYTQNITITPMYSQNFEGNEAIAVYTHIYYNGGHYQPIQVENELLHTIDTLSPVVFQHLKIKQAE